MDYGHSIDEWAEDTEDDFCDACDDWTNDDGHGNCKACGIKYKSVVGPTSLPAVATAYSSVHQFCLSTVVTFMVAPQVIRGVVVVHGGTEALVL